jgi:hypothetical protein
MILKPSLSILAVLGLSLALPAQEKDAAAPVQIRAVLHNPANPVASLFFTDKSGAVVPLEFRPQDLTRPLFMLPTNGSLVLHDKASVNPKNPAASMAASIKLPPGLKRAIVVILPAPPNKKPAYQMLLIDDSEKAFPGGESRALALLNVECAMQAGEHKLPVKPGSITRVPPVRKVDDFNMAQTNFYYQQGESWVAFAERQLQFLDATRRIFIIHATPGAQQPTVTTIVDTSL